MATVRELQRGIWHWEAPHPDWKPGEEWDQVVSSYAIDDGDRLLLFDPLAPPSEIDELAAGRETAIVLICPWHVRDARSLAERLGAPLYVPPPDQGDPNPVEGHVFSAGDRLPVGVEAFPGDGAERPRALDPESPGARRRRHARRPRPRPRIPGRLGEQGRSARADPRGAAPAARAAGRARAPGARGPTDRAALERALS